jgi:2-keto-myo-inositol isomerase
MIPCINQATVMKADTLQFIESAGRNGFPQVEFDIDRLEAGIKQDSLATIRAGIEEAGLEVVSLNARDNYPILSDDDMSSSLARTAKVLDLARSVDCNILILNPANFGSPAEVKLVERRFDEFVERVLDLAERRGVRIAYEYVSYDNKVVNDLPKTLAALERWGKNVFLVLDVFHMYRKGETMKDLPESYMDRLLAFHVNDAPEMPIARVVDTDRVLPLDGVIGVKNYMIDLKARGYKGPVSVELFNEKYWQMDVDLAIQKSKASIDNLLSF